MLKDAIKLEILSSRAISYRVTALATAGTMALINWFPGIDYSKLALFGITPPAGADAKVLVLVLGWALVVYHLGFFLYYAWRDVRLWLQSALEFEPPDVRGFRSHFPEWPMFFGCPPRKLRNRKLGDVEQEIWTTDRNWMPLVWTGVAPKLERNASISGFGYQVANNNGLGFRQRMRWYLLIDIGLPLAIAAFAVGLWSSIWAAILAAVAAVFLGILWAYWRG